MRHARPPRRSTRLPAHPAAPISRHARRCAAPGSKTSHIATNFLRDAPGSELVSCERNHGKLAKLRQLCEGTFGLRCVRPTRADTTRLVLPSTDDAEVEAAAGASPGAGAAEDGVVAAVVESIAAPQGLRADAAAVAGSLSEMALAPAAPHEPGSSWTAPTIAASELAAVAGPKGELLGVDSTGGASVAERVGKRHRKKAAQERARALGRPGRSGGAASGSGHGSGKNGGGVPGLHGYSLGYFDRVLVDPPCSALGLRPKLLQNATLSDAFGSQVPSRPTFPCPLLTPLPHP